MATQSKKNSRIAPSLREGQSFGQLLRYYLNPFDGRFEDLRKGPWYMNVLRDFTAGLIVAMVAIP